MTYVICSETRQLNPCVMGKAANFEAILKNIEPRANVKKFCLNIYIYIYIVIQNHTIDFFT